MQSGRLWAATDMAQEAMASVARLGNLEASQCLFAGRSFLILKKK
jgi:hypothetical protein